MSIHPIYRSFFTFLDHIDDGGNPWDLYQRLYLRPHRRFLHAYWQLFRRFDMEQVRRRVTSIRRGDYAALEGLIAQLPPEEIAEEALSRCYRIIPPLREPEVYLMMGFFSPDGFIVHLDGVPAIGIGLERFKDFGLLGVIVAHEYCHYLRASSRAPSTADGEKTLGEVILSEGLSAVFSELVFPERGLDEHLFIPRNRLNWCLKNEECLRRAAMENLNLAPAEASPFGYGSSFPQRVEGFIGYRIVREHLRRRGAKAIFQLFRLKDIGDLTYYLQ